MECFDDIEVHDEHPSYYGYQATDYGEGPYHEHSTSNYDHLVRDRHHVCMHSYYNGGQLGIYVQYSHTLTIFEISL